MSDTVIYQGSGGTIGDIFFSSMPMYHHKGVTGDNIHVALPSSLNPEIRELYERHTFLDAVHELPSIQKEDLIPYAQTRGYKVNLFLESHQYIKGMKFYRLDDWFKNDAEPTISGNGLLGVQVMSSRHWSRPKIPRLDRYLEMALSVGLKPVFMGTEQDEGLFLETYPGVRKYCLGDEFWRFGKDTIKQTIANTGVVECMFVFSSWTTYSALGQGVPAIELWSSEQWLFYTPMVKQMLGNPIHHIQERFDSPPHPALFRAILPRYKYMASILY